MNHSRLASTRFPAVRRAMGRERALLNDAQLAAFLTERMPGAEVRDVEDFMRSLQKFARQAAPVAQRALAGAASGAATGMVAGPYGALAGALIGGTAGALTTPAPTPQPRAASRPTVPPMAAPGQAAPGQAAPGQPSRPTPAASGGSPAAARPAGSPAAAQLLMLLSRPETVQALLALLLNRSRVPVGGAQVPSAAFANALSEFALRAAEEAQPAKAGRQAYYFDAQGRARCDLADDAARAQLLFEDLCQGSTCGCQQGRAAS